MKHIGRLFMLLAVVALVAGCKGGGSGPTASFVAPAAPAFVAPPAEEGGDGGVNTVVNPEPTSMILMGIGLAGAALARRRKKA